MGTISVHIGLRMLFHDKKRLLLSMMGISFSVVIMFMQMGFFNGINDSQANIVHLMNADAVLLHKKRTNLNKWNRFPIYQVQQTLVAHGVKEIIPVYKEGVGLKNPATNQYKRMIIYSFPPATQPFNLRDASRSDWASLRVRGRCFFDKRSREIYGPFSVGDDLDVEGKNLKLHKFVTIGPNIINDGTLMCSQTTFQKQKRPIMALIRLGSSNKVETLATLKKILPDDLLLLTPEQLAEREIRYMTVNAPIGAIFGIGLLVSLFIGTVICYQILYNEITDNLSQYATLKAMGFDDLFLYKIILEEASVLSVLGFIPGLIFATFIYNVTSDATRLIMEFSTLRITALLFITITMCLLAGFLAMRKVLKLDPAELY
jgi:putative ABC transport system permease protein